MDAEEFFATCWPAMVPGVRAALARAGASSADRDDLIQETALRLFGMWSAIDWARPVEPLARRIAMNAFRDQWRRRGEREVLTTVPERVAVDDTERTAIARIEVSEVSRALESLPAQTARVLRVAVEESEGPSAGPSAAALRMARTRARRALAACLKVASAVVAAAVVACQHVLRSTRLSAGAAAMGAMACAILWGAAQSGSPAATKVPAFFTSIGATVVAPAHQSPVRAGGYGHPSRVSALRHVRSRASSSEIPWYRIPAGPAEVDAFVDLDVEGHGVRLARPQPGSRVPVCTYGSTPTLAVAPRC